MNDELIELPGNYAEQELALQKNKHTYMEYIFKKIESSIVKNNLLSVKSIRLFKFKNTKLVVVVNDSHYKSLLNNLITYYSKLEEYEKCSLLNKIKIVNN